MQALEGDLDVELGYGYQSSAVMADGAHPPAHENPRASHGRPGTRAPHVWLDRHGERISTLDLLGRRFVVLAAPEGETWCDAARPLAASGSLDLDLHVVGRQG